jgi:hypothetical protein
MTTVRKSMSEYVTLPQRPFDYTGHVLSYRTACGSLFLTISIDTAGSPTEVFIVRGNSGGCAQAFSEALGKMVSVALRSGFDPAEVVKLFTQIRCDGGSWHEGKRITSCPGAIALALQYVLDTRHPDVVPAVGVGPGIEEKIELSDAEVKQRMQALAEERERQGI